MIKATLTASVLKRNGKCMVCASFRLFSFVLSDRAKGPRHAFTDRFSATTLQIPALWPTGAGELNGSDACSWAGSFWPEPVLRTCAFHLRTDWSDRPTGQMESGLCLNSTN